MLSVVSKERRRLHIGNLAYDVESRDILDKFDKFGKIHYCRQLNPDSLHHHLNRMLNSGALTCKIPRKDGRNQGFAFLLFDDITKLSAKSVV